MSRDDGFAVMDVDTDIVNDPKFRRIQRSSPEHVAPAIAAYVAILGESWHSGRRVQIGDAWPVILPVDDAVVASMIEAGLLDRRGMLPAKVWKAWFEPVKERRDASRARWQRANDKRSARGEGGAPAGPRGSNGNDPLLPRGDRAVTDTIRSVPFRSDPSVPPARPHEVGRKGDTEFDRRVAATQRELARTRGDA